MRWQRGARLGLAAVGLGCAAAIYFLARRPEAPPPPLAPIVIDEQATEQGGAGTVVRRHNDGERGKIVYERFAKYGDGRTVFFKAGLVIAEEPAVDAWADVIEISGRPGQGLESGRAELQGNVRVATDDGLELKSDRARYEDETGLVTIQGPFSYTQGRISGQGVDGTYTRLEKLLTITDQAKASVAPGADGETATTATSKSMVLVRALRQLRLEERAEIVRQAERLTGDRATLHFSTDEQHVGRVELQGQARVEPTGAPGASSPPEMRGQTIDLTLHDGGQALRRAVVVGQAEPASMVVGEATARTSITAPALEAELAPDGSTLIRLEGKPHQGRAGGAATGAAAGRVVVNLPAAADTPAREVAGDWFVARGEPGQGLRSARFTGRATYVERPAAGGSAVRSRNAKADRLDLALDGRLNAVRTADFQGQASFADGATTATGDQAIYGAADKTLKLRQAPRSTILPHAETSRATVDAREMDIWLDSQDLVARGDVQAELRPDAAGRTGGAASGAGIFDRGKPVRGRAATLHYRGSEAVFEGVTPSLANLTQDDSSVDAEVLTLVTDTNNLRATRQVTARFQLAAPATTPAARGGAAGTSTPASAPRATRYTITGHGLEYDDKARALVATRAEGAQVTLTTSDGTVDADRIVFTLEPGTRALRNFVATGNVSAVLDEAAATGRAARGAAERQRRAVCDQFEFIAAGERYVLIGRPSATVLVPQETGPLCQRFNGVRLEFARGTRDLSGHSSSMTDVPCTTPVR